MLVNLDANVLMELLDGSLADPEVLQILDEEDICLTPLTIHIVWYFWEKGRIRCSKSELKEVVLNSIILTIKESTCKTALMISREEDIEDGMQIACCMENKVNLVLTKDVEMYAKYGSRINMKLLN